MSSPSIEVFGRIERRRRFSVQQKLAVPAEATGANVSAVARRHGLARGVAVTTLPRLPTEVHNPVRKAKARGRNRPAKAVDLSVENAIRSWPTEATVRNAVTVARGPSRSATNPATGCISAKGHMKIDVTSPASAMLSANSACSSGSATAGASRTRKASRTPANSRPRQTHR